MGFDFLMTLGGGGGGAGGRGNRLKVEFDSQGLFILFYFFKLSFRKKNIYMSYELFYVEYFEPFISKTILADIFLKTTCYSF